MPGPHCRAAAAWDPSPHCAPESTRDGARRLGATRCAGRVARLHPDVDVRRQPPDHRRPGRGPRADRRRRQALPRRDLVAVGHDARPPRTRARRRDHAASSRSAHTPRCSGTATGSWSSSRRRWPASCPSTIRTSSTPATAHRAVEQALKIAFQYWHNRGVTGRTTFLAFGGAYHGDTIGALSVGDDGFGADVFNALRFPVVRAPAFDDPRCFDVAVRDGRRHTPTSSRP